MATAPAPRPAPPARPALAPILLSVLVGLPSLLTLPGLITQPLPDGYPEWFRLFGIANCLVMVAACVGLLKRRWWGLGLLVLGFTSSQIVQLQMGKWDMTSTASAAVLTTFAASGARRSSDATPPPAPPTS